MDPREDAELMRAAGRGDREAFGLLVEQHHRAIIRFIHRFLGTRDPDVAEDLAQDVFLEAWRAAASFEPRAKVLTWLLRIAANDCLNYRRSSRLRVMVSLDADDSAVPAAPRTRLPETSVHTSERAEQVRAAIASLPPMQRAAILLRHFHGLSYRDTADALDTTVSAVESLLFRARRTLGAGLAAGKPDALPQVSP